MMDCDAARLLLAFSHPSGRELAAEEATILEGHLAECAECARQARREQRFDAWLGPAMRAVPVPIALKERVLGKLVERRPVPKSRRWLRPVVIASGAAAALLLVGLALGWSLWHRPVPDVDSLVAEYHYRPQSARTVQESFQSDYGVNVVAPTQFDYQHLIWYGLQKHGNRNVPVLVFARQIGDRLETARVYIFSDRDFKLSAVPAELPQVSGGCSVRKLPSADVHFMYLVLYTSERLEDFFPADGPDGAAA